MFPIFPGKAGSVKKGQAKTRPGRLSNLKLLINLKSSHPAVSWKKTSLYFPTISLHLTLGNNAALQTETNISEQLFRQHVSAMYHHAVRITGNKKDAEDIVQDSFLQAFAKLDQLKEAAAFGGWLRSIVVRNAIRFCKKKIRWDDLNEYAETAEEEEWWKGIPLDNVHEAIKKLPEGCRQVFALYVFEDHTHKEIAAELGISESTSKSQYQRARKLLKETLWMHSKNM